MKRFLPNLTTLFLVTLFFGSLITHAQRQMENLNRHVVAIRTSSSQVFVSWRMLGTEYTQGATFNLYRGTTQIASNLNTTNYVDNTSSNSTYSVSAVIGGSEQSRSASAGVWTNNYTSVPISPPSSNHHANDCSVGDLDGDGDYEIVLKWEANDAKDNSQSGYTDVVYLDGIELNGTRLWRINLGINIRAGAHYTQFMVYDLDGDGKAEVACKTAPGTRSGTGSYLSNGPAASDNDAADYRNSSGYILSGPEYLTIFNGQTGAELATTNYVPPRGNVSDWGDSYGNRVDRFLACIAYLDGTRPSLVMCRGYYTRAVLAAWDWRNGNLTQRWVFDTWNGYSSYEGQGNHNLSVADVDSDGRDEIIYGSCAINDNGSGLWNSGLGHGDAMHVSDINRSRSGLEVWGIHEGTSTPGSALLDARTGAVVWQTSNADVGRGVSADLTSASGMECWGGTSGLRTATNSSAGSTPASSNHLIWWDGDEYRELLDGTSITKYGGGTLLSASGCSSNNGTKSNPCLTVDIFGDWREEAIWRTSDNNNLRIYTSTSTTSRRMYTMMHDPQYRLSIAWQNVAYNQPPHTGFFFGNGMSSPPNPNITLIGGSTPSNNPPSVSITSPSNGATFTEGANITISANASDNDGSIALVEFFRGSTKLGEDATSPYSYTWNNAAAGTYSLTARATDDDGASTTSSAVNITVNSGGTGTTITIQENQTGFCGVDGTVDNNNSGFTGDGFANTANATGNGIDYKVTFSASGTYSFTFRYASTSSRPARLLINGSTAISTINFPSTGSWTTWTTVTASAGVNAGTFDVRLEATGTSGLANIDYMQVTGTTPSAASCSGTPVNNPPSISITSPSNGATYTAGDNVTINASASDSDGSISLVEFFRGSTKLGEDATSPYSYTWNNIPEGNYALTARATDDDGATTTSQTVTITVNSAPVCDPTPITPYVQINGGSWQQTSTASVNTGDDVKFGPQPVSGGSWSWSGPNGFSASTREVTISNIQLNQAGTYVAAYTNDCGAQSYQNFSVTVEGGSTPVTITIQENTDGFCSVDGTIDNNNSGYTGTGFANTTNASGMGITWSVNVPSGGSYSLQWRYANGTTTNRTGQLMVDGSTVVSTVNFTGTGGWTTWTTTSSTNVNLSAGTRLIRLQATTTSGLANIDYISITGINPQPVSCAGQKSTMTQPLTQDFQNSLEVYPNPFSGNSLELRISIVENSGIKVIIFNSRGEMVYIENLGLQEAGSIYHSMDAGFLSSGLYVVMMQYEGGYLTIPLICQ